MPQINDIRELAQQNARYVSNSPQDWMSYLDVAARLYRYSFTDTLLIHAQRPDATACAEMELWNQKMSRWVNRGAKGIALLDDTGPRTKLRYVFDIADTHLVRGGRTPILWNLDSHEHEQERKLNIGIEICKRERAYEHSAGKQIGRCDKHRIHDDQRDIPVDEIRYEPANHAVPYRRASFTPEAGSSPHAHSIPPCRVLP